MITTPHWKDHGIHMCVHVPDGRPSHHSTENGRPSHRGTDNVRFDVPSQAVLVVLGGPRSSRAGDVLLRWMRSVLESLRPPCSGPRGGNVLHVPDLPMPASVVKMCILSNNGKSTWYKCGAC